MSFKVHGVTSYSIPKTSNSSPIVASVVALADAADGIVALYVVGVVTKGNAVGQLRVNGLTLCWTLNQETFLSTVPKGTTKQRRSRKWREERNLQARQTGLTVAVFHSSARGHIPGYITINRGGQTLTLHAP